jgi:hypothetical protein
VQLGDGTTSGSGKVIRGHCVKHVASVVAGITADVVTAVSAPFMFPVGSERGFSIVDNWWKDRRKIFVAVFESRPYLRFNIVQTCKTQK